jgi:hypothetical protein
MHLPATPELLAISRRIIWFEEPMVAIAQPVRFLAYAMRYATHEDMKSIRAHVSDDEFRAALRAAPAGIIDPRSWAYWHVRMGIFPPPPLPERCME